MKVAPEGQPFILWSTAILAALATLAWWRGGLWWLALALWLPLAIWTPAFFRVPNRSGPRDPQLVLAPADGRVVNVASVHEPEFLRGPATRVSIFMNVFDVHINYYPVGGVVSYLNYRTGAFINATLDKASENNEQMSIGIQSPRGPILVRQIAGLIARRIVSDAGMGDGATQGERLGMIRFGSRVDTFLPPGARSMVAPGDRTMGGVTVIGRWDS